MDAELAPFMRGEFLIFDMRLVRPKMNVSVDADGKVDWAMRPSSPFDPAQIAIEKLTITEGQVRISHATSGRDHLVSEINAEVSAKSLDGPWRADGSLRLDGMLHGDRAVDRQGRRQGRAAAAHQGRPGDLSRRNRKRRRRHHRTRRRKICRDHAYRSARRYAGRRCRRAGRKRRRPRPSCRHGVCAAASRSIMPGSPSIQFRFETGPADDPYTADGSAYVALDANPRFSVTAAGAQVRFDEAMIADKDPAGADVSRPDCGDPGSAARLAEAVDPGLDRCRLAGSGGRRHDDPRRQDAGRAGARRVAGQDAVGIAARAHDARGVGAAQDRRERFRLRRLAACRRRTTVRFRCLAVQGRRRGDPPAAGCRLQGDSRSHHGAPAVQRLGTHPRQGEIPGRDRKQRAERRQPVDAGGTHRQCARRRRAGGVLGAVRQRAAAARVSPIAISTSR